MRGETYGKKQAIRAKIAIGKIQSPTIQRKLTMSPSDDPLEREADRIADQVMSMPVDSAINNTPARIQRFTPRPDSLIGKAPASIDRVLSGAGRPLEPASRQDMEARFGYDFSEVRVHSDAIAAESTRGLNADAYTIGQNIVFGEGKFAPETQGGRHLIAHELTHVVQQSSENGFRPHGIAAEENYGGTNVTRNEVNNATLSPEHDTYRIADDTVQGLPLIAGIAPRGLPQYQRQRGRGRIQSQEHGEVTEGAREELEGRDQAPTWIFGGVTANPRAKGDIRHRGNLLPGPDQSHINFRGERLGYRGDGVVPHDPFRWEKLKDIIDRGNVHIFAVPSSASFNVRIVNDSAGPPRQARYTLLSIPSEEGGGANGVTLLRESRHRAIEPTHTEFLASPNDTKDQIYYASDREGRGLLLGNALAHEFFGHYWLSVQGVPHRHRSSLTAAHGILDPFGQPFEGPVSTFINRFTLPVDPRQGGVEPVDSPTIHVSEQYLQETLEWFDQNGSRELTGGWASTSVDPISVGSDFQLYWTFLRNNYYSLQETRREGLVEQIRNWFTRLNPDQQYVFLRFLEETGSWHAIHERRPALRNAIWELLPEDMRERMREQYSRSLDPLREGR